MRIGSLFSGYGGLDLAVAAHFGATVAWHVECDKWPSAILAHHYPDIPNYGDVTAVDWSAVEPVDIITGGFPCQDVSHAGLRAGVHQGTRSGLWFEMARAIDALKPWKVVIENVAGLLSADAASTVEPCPWCVGDQPDGHMRALGAVLADLAEMGFDADWGCVRAADAGAPHGRLRVFIVAPNRAGDQGRQQHRDGDTATDAKGTAGWGGHQGQGTQLSGGADSEPAAADSDGRQLPGAAVGVDGLPVAGEHDLRTDGLTLLPTPAVNDMGAGKTVEGWDEWTADMRQRHGNGNGHGKSLEIEAQRLLPTPKASDGPNGGPGMRNGRGEADALPGVVTRDIADGTLTDFGPYTAAIRRWEAVIGRTAPSPTEPGKDGRPRLSAKFVEFMMGLPDGWVTGVDIPRSAQLKALGNGVVPHQAALALELLDGA